MIMYQIPVLLLAMAGGPANSAVTDQCSVWLSMSHYVPQVTPDSNLSGTKPMSCLAYD